MHLRPIHDPPEGPRVPVTPIVTRMQRLREATRVVHTRIEGVLPLLDPGLTRTRYIRVVEAFYGFYAPLEPCIARAVGAEGAALTLELRAKLPLLATDLRALGRTDAELEDLPRCRDVPTVDTASHAIGTLYVIEGATLGGQIIRKHLRDGLAIEAVSGAAFFTGYGARTGAMWSGFGEHVDRSPTLDTAVAVAAAVATFQTLTVWLEASLSAA